MALVKTQKQEFANPQEFFKFCEQIHARMIDEMVNSGFDTKSARNLAGSPLDTWARTRISFANDNLVEVQGCDILVGYPAHYVTITAPSFKEAVVKAYQIAGDLPSNPTRERISGLLEKY